MFGIIALHVWLGHFISINVVRLEMDGWIEVKCAGQIFTAPQVDCGDQIRLNHDGRGFNLTIHNGVTCALGCGSGEAIPANITCGVWGVLYCILFKPNCNSTWSPPLLKEHWAGTITTRTSTVTIRCWGRRQRIKSSSSSSSSSSSPPLRPISTTVAIAMRIR